MPHAEDFHLASLQLSLFTQAVSGFTGHSFLAKVLGGAASPYDGSVIAPQLPSEIELPPDVPRAILQSADQRWKLEGSPTRINTYWLRQTPEEEVPVDVLTRCMEFHLDYAKDRAVVPIRMALVVNRYAPSADPSEALIKWFCSIHARTGPLRRSAAFELHNHKVYRLGGQECYRVNSWVRLRTAAMATTGEPLVTVEQDINTTLDPEHPSVFAPEQLPDFWTSARRDVDSILDLYFSPSQVAAKGLG
jgi:hypothetical protein